MKTEKHGFLLAIIVGILSGSVLAGTESPQLEGGDLIGYPNITLSGIQELNVLIEYPDNEPNISNLPWKELQDRVEKGLKKAGLKIASEHYQEIKSTALEIPELIISLEAYRLSDSERYVLHIQTFLSRAVHLAKERRWLVKADVWKSAPVMRLVYISEVSVVVHPLLMNQVGTFVNAYLLANPAGTPVSDVNAAGAGSHKAARERAKSAVEQPPVRYEYVASKNGRVFHKAGCASARNILPENLVGYNSRDEAVQADKRPCKQCKP